MNPKFKIEVEKKTINELIEEIEKGFVDYRIPYFQRDYVWDSDDVKDLIDSIIKSYPIGNIIIWEPSHEFERRIRGSSESIIKLKEEASKKHYILDGQQRLTSLLLVFNGWEIPREDGRKIVLDMPIAYVPGKRNKFEKSRKRPLDFSRVLVAIRNHDIDEETKIREMVGKDNYERVKEIVTRFERYVIPIYKISTVNENEEVFKEMAEAFVRINKQGVRISNVQLMLSFLAGSIQGRLKEQIMELYNKYYDKFGLDLQVIIRVIFSNFEGAKIKQTQLAKINQVKSNIRKIEKVYNQDYADEMIKRTDTAIQKTLELIKNELNISDPRILPSQITLIPIIKYIYKKENDLSEGERKDIIKWFILANFKGRYSTSTYTKLDKDLELINSSGSNAFRELMQLIPGGGYISERDIFKGKEYNLRRVQGRAYLFLLYILLIKNNAEDLTGRLIKSRDFGTLEKHHIFPKEFLEENLDVEDENKKEILINNLGNITLIDGEINSRISADDPKEYLEDYEEDKIEKHFIPLDRSLWNIDKYEEFLNKRLKLIYEGGKKLLPDIFS